MLKLGDWHVVFLHFPIALLCTGLVFDVLGALFKIKVYPAGHWIVIMAVVMTIPTVITGLDLTEVFGKNRYFDLHKNWGLITLSYGLVHGLYRVYVLRTKKTIRPWLLVGLSLIGTFLMVITADLGGLIVFGQGFLKPFLNRSP